MIMRILPRAFYLHSARLAVPGHFLRYAGGAMRGWARLMAMAVLAPATGLAGCATGFTTLPVKFTNATPGAPQEISATLVRPARVGPFPAVVQLHGCGGLEAQSYRWARWLAAHGYIALVVDSFGPRAVKGDCRSGPDEP